MPHDPHKNPTGAGASTLEGIDYLELYVGNARHAAHYFRTAFGFAPVAYAGPETGARDRVSITLAQSAVRLVLTSPTTPRGAIAEHLARRGDGVRDVGLAVADAAAAFDRAVAAGAEPVAPPVERADALGSAVTATVRAFGDTTHTFVERRGYAGAFLPGFAPVERPGRSVATGLDRVDHLAICVEQGSIGRWVDFYLGALAMTLAQEETISSDYSGMETQVLRSGGGRVIFVLVEPKPGRRSSPIQEFLDYYGGAGVHHVALASSNIVASVGALRENGVEFSRTPETYYDGLRDRDGSLDYELDDLRRQNILVDREDRGRLYQIFTKPAQARPTYFFEIIERRDAVGFGNGNITALFESIEREQAARGNG